MLGTQGNGLSEVYFILRAQNKGRFFKTFVKLVSEILCIIASKGNGN